MGVIFDTQGYLTHSLLHVKDVDYLWKTLESLQQKYTSITVWSPLRNIWRIYVIDTTCAWWTFLRKTLYYLQPIKYLSNCKEGINLNFINDIFRLSMYLFSTNISNSKVPKTSFPSYSWTADSPEVQWPRVIHHSL